MRTPGTRLEDPVAKSQSMSRGASYAGTCVASSRA